MSVVFVVGSEEQLSSGAAWCQRLAEQNECDINIVVLGVDRKTLAEYARRKMGEQLESSEKLTGENIKVELVEAEPDAVLAHAQSVSCKTLLIIQRTDEAEFQRRLFERSMAPTILVRANQQPPPDSPDHLFAMFRRPSLFTSIASEKLFGFAPATAICEDVNLDKDDLVATVAAAMESISLQPGDLVLCGVEDTTPSDRVYKSGLALMEQSGDVTVALVHNGHSVTETIATKLQQWTASVAPPMEREQRIELAQDLQIGSKPNLEFLGLISASSMLAAFGLLQDSAAVIIGAMLIAPLMTPIVGAGLGLAQGNRPLFQSAFWTVVLGFVGALFASMMFGWLFWLFKERTITDEMWKRCEPSTLDFCVGLVGGIAASYARTREHLSSALAGAAIAAALVPPISTAGLQVAFGAWNWDKPHHGVPIAGPLLLVAINVLMIMIGSSFVLWARGMRSDRTVTFKDRWTVRMFALLSVLALLTLIWMLQRFDSA